MTNRDELANDIALMSAGYLWNFLKQIAALPPEEGYVRLAAHFRAALAALIKETEPNIPEPSRN